MAVSQPQILITLQQNVFFLRVNKYRMRRNTNKQNLEVPDLLSRNMQTKTPTFIRTPGHTGKILIGKPPRSLNVNAHCECKYVRSQLTLYIFEDLWILARFEGDKERERPNTKSSLGCRFEKLWLWRFFWALWLLRANHGSSQTPLAGCLCRFSDVVDHSSSPWTSSPLSASERGVERIPEDLCLTDCPNFEVLTSW